MSKMTWNNKPDPDFSRLEKVVRRQGEPDRVPFFELFSNIQEESLEMIGEGAVAPDEDSERDAFILKRHIEHQYRLGYDYISLSAKKGNFPRNPNSSAQTAQGERSYNKGADHTIASREDFEKYPWPKISNIDCQRLEDVKAILPEGMMSIAGRTGILENVMWLLGYEGISYLLYDDEKLVADMFDRVGSFIVEHMDIVASCDVVGGIKLGEDMGFRTATMLNPEVYRKYLFPWHKKLVDVVHKHGKMAIVHACGNLEMIMEDIIDCGWDARHSFEDGIQPVREAKEKYGDRIAHLGGFDMHKIATMSVEEVRRHTRRLIEKCAPGGGWALGTGNSVANYVPTENYLAMLDEGLAAGRY